MSLEVSCVRVLAALLFVAVFTAKDRFVSISKGTNILEVLSKILRKRISNFFNKVLRKAALGASHAHVTTFADMLSPDV